MNNFLFDNFGIILIANLQSTSYLLWLRIYTLRNNFGETII